MHCCKYAPSLFMGITDVYLFIMLTNTLTKRENNALSCKFKSTFSGALIEDLQITFVNYCRLYMKIFHQTYVQFEITLKKGKHPTLWKHPTT